MKISFDVNGVLDTYPHILFPLIQLLRASGHEVGIATGLKRTDLPGQWDVLFDFFITCDPPHDDVAILGKAATTDEEKMRDWKNVRLTQENVDLHFDDFADAMNSFNNKTAVNLRIGPKK